MRGRHELGWTAKEEALLRRLEGLACDGEGMDPVMCGMRVFRECWSCRILEQEVGAGQMTGNRVYPTVISQAITGAEVD
jgi:hypothetical protein